MNHINYSINGIDLGNNYQIDTVNYAFDLGGYGISPWNITNTRFANARLIWNDSNGVTSSPGFIYIWFYYSFFYNGATNTGTLFSACDDFATFYISNTSNVAINTSSGYGNGITINAGSPGGLTNSITINNGMNYIRVLAYNSNSAGGPASLLISIYDSAGNNIVNTNSDWVYTVATYYMFGKRNASNFSNDPGYDIYNYQVDSVTYAIDVGGRANAPSGWTISTNLANARIIWNVANSNTTSVAANVYIWFYYSFYYSGSTNTGTLYYFHDDFATYYISSGGAFTSILNSSYTGSSSSISITITKGMNYIRICAYNSGGAAGLMAAIYDSAGNNIINTNSSWAITTSSAYNSGAATFNT